MFQKSSVFNNKKTNTCNSDDIMIAQILSQWTGVEKFDSILKMIQAIYVCIAIKILKVITYFAMGSIESRETMTQRIIVDNATCSRMHAEIITSITFDYSFMKNQMIIKQSI